MESESKQEKTREAIGQMLALVPELRDLKDEVVRRLEQGESEESVQAWFIQAIGDTVTPVEHELGMDALLAQWATKFARTGEPGSMLAGMEGGVWIQEQDADGEPCPIVIAMVGPFSDIREIQKDFKKACDKAFRRVPRRRFRDPNTAARHYRLHREGTSWGDMARAKVREDRPDLEEDSESFRELAEIEREAIKKAGTRWGKDYWDKLLNFLSPKSK
jgi:hypothetical protein